MENKDTFVGIVDKNGIIYAKEFGSKKDTEVGWDMKAVRELQQDRDNCYSKAEQYLEELYVAGVRQRPKTPEQKESEQAEINSQIMQSLKGLMEEVKSLKEARNNVQQS